MKYYEEIFRRYWLKGLNETDGKPKIGLSEWLEQNRFQLPITPSTTSFTVSSVNRDEYYSILAFDCNSLVAATIETGRGLEKNINRPKELAWLLIKSYYSAFFSAHAILRICGRGILFINPQISNNFGNAASIYGYTLPSFLNTSSRTCLYEANSSDLSIKFIARPTGGQSHQLLWREFSLLLKNISESLLNLSGNNTQVQFLSTQIDHLISLMRQYNCSRYSNWLSVVRNEITYKQKHGTWFPYRDQDRREIEEINYIVQKYLKVDITASQDISIWTTKTYLIRFLLICKYIVNLCLITVFDMEKRHPLNKSFLKYGALKLYKETAI